MESIMGRKKGKSEPASLDKAFPVLVFPENRRQLEEMMADTRRTFRAEVAVAIEEHYKKWKALKGN